MPFLWKKNTRTQRWLGKNKTSWKKYFEKTIPIVPQLLGWVNDGNWPISRPLSEFLNKHMRKTSSQDIEVLNGNYQLDSIPFYGPVIAT